MDRTLTKPCERAPVGCAAIIRRSLLTPSLYMKRRFCSARCAALARYEAGAQPPRMTHAQRVEAGRKGGAVSGARRRRVAATRVAEYLGQYITPEIEEVLSPRQLARMKVMLSRAFNDGHIHGRSAGRMAKTSAA